MVFSYVSSISLDEARRQEMIALMTTLAKRSIGLLAQYPLRSGTTGRDPWKVPAALSDMRRGWADATARMFLTE